MLIDALRCMASIAAKHRYAYSTGFRTMLCVKHDSLGGSGLSEYCIGRDSTVQSVGLLWKSILLAVVFLVVATPAKPHDHRLILHDVLQTIRPLNKIVEVAPIPSAGIGPDEVLQLADSAFLPWDKVPASPTREAWVRFVIVNASDLQQNNLLSTCEQPDSAQYFVLSEGRLQPLAVAGSKVPRRERQYPRLSNYINLHLAPRDSVVVYAHLFMQGVGQWPHNYHLHIRSASEGITAFLEQYTVQAFYSGIMTVFMVVSLLMFISFREWMFVSYAGMMLMMNLYFLYYSNIIRSFLLPVTSPTFLFSNQWVVGGIVVTCALFITQYIDLRSSMPRYRKVYLTYSFLLGAFAVVWGVWLTKDYGHLNLLNFSMLPWIVLSFYPIIRRSLLRERAALVLLFSVLLITVGASVNLLSLTGILPIDGNGMVPFQLGTLAYSGSLFFGLFTMIRQIQNERAQSDAVLFNVLPRDIATELKEQGESEARYLERVTVLFTDFVDFTRISARMRPSELVQELNTLFSRFDEIVTRHGLEKIKTIGDSYMVAGGLRESHAHEADRVIAAAIEMQQWVQQRYAERTQQGLPTFTMRAGVHTGPVVAGVVGVVKFQYDIWGDTVNTASRMESAGDTGRVNISNDTYELVKNDAQFSFESRGSVDAKGIGPVQMWFVLPG